MPSSMMVPMRLTHYLAVLVALVAAITLGAAFSPASTPATLELELAAVALEAAPSMAPEAPALHEVAASSELLAHWTLATATVARAASSNTANADMASDSRASPRARYALRMPHTHTPDRMAPETHAPLRPK